MREYVKSKGLESILNELYGIYDTPDDIDFSKLPNSFVLKDTLGGGGNSVIIVDDKSKISDEQFEQMQKQMWEWVNEPTNRKHPGREWVYDGRKHRIIAEKYIEAPDKTVGLIDYKVFCFNGKAEYLYVISNRKLGIGAEVGIYDRSYKLLPYYRKDELKPTHKIDKPNNYENMIKIAETIATDFPHVRVDMYNVSDKIYFGEMTFYNGSGYMSFEPDEFDYILGEKFKLDLIKREI